MHTLSERLIGRSVLSIEISEPDQSTIITFSDEAWLTSYTEVVSSVAGSKSIKQVTMTDKEIFLRLSGGDFISISVDRDRFPDVIEFFVYKDAAGYVVEN